MKKTLKIIRSGSAEQIADEVNSILTTAPTSEIISFSAENGVFLCVVLVVENAA